MADAAYNRGKFLVASGDLDWENDTIRVLLLDDDESYTFDATHNVVADLTPGTNELSGLGYSRQTLANATATEDDTDDQAELDADDVSWPGLDAGIAQAAVVYREVTDDSDSELLGYFDTGFPFPSNGGDLTWQFHADGVFTVP